MSFLPDDVVAFIDATSVSKSDRCAAAFGDAYMVTMNRGTPDARQYFVVTE